MENNFFLFFSKFKETFFSAFSNLLRNSLIFTDPKTEPSWISVDNKDELICARLGCPLIIGQGKSEYFIASDVSALLGVTRKII